MTEFQFNKPRRRSRAARQADKFVGHVLVLAAIIVAAFILCFIG